MEPSDRQICRLVGFFGQGAGRYLLDMKCSWRIGGLLPALALVLIGGGHSANAQSKETQSGSEQEIVKKLSGLRQLDDEARAKATKDLALEIRRLPYGPAKLGLASSLGNLATEGDQGQDTVQAVTDTLCLALQESLAAGAKDVRPFLYLQIAQFQRYEHANVNLKSASLDAAIADLVALEEARGKLDFTLTDLHGKPWTLSALKGKVVLVNFWATWCPPCRKEMPDMQKLYSRFKDNGFVILAISDEERSKVEPFIKEHGYTYPILLDPGRKVNTAYKIDGIPKSFIYDRNGKFVAMAIDGRSERQLLELLAKAGLK